MKKIVLSCLIVILLVTNPTKAVFAKSSDVFYQTSFYYEDHIYAIKIYKDTSDYLMDIYKNSNVIASNVIMSSPYARFEVMKAPEKIQELTIINGDNIRYSIDGVQLEALNQLNAYDGANFYYVSDNAIYQNKILLFKCPLKDYVFNTIYVWNKKLYCTYKNPDETKYAVGYAVTVYNLESYAFEENSTLNKLDINSGYEPVFMGNYIKGPQIIYASKDEKLIMTYNLTDTGWVKSYEKNPLGFTDVSKLDWFYDSIIYVKNNSLIKGYADGTFKPSQVISNSEYYVIMDRLLRLPVRTSVPGESWSVPYMESYMDFIGYTAYDERLNILETRESIAIKLFTSLERLGAFQGQWESQNKYDNKWSDIKSPMMSYIYGSLSDLGVMNGYNDHTMRPSQNVTRAEFAKMIVALSPHVNKYLVENDLK